MIEVKFRGVYEYEFYFFKLTDIGGNYNGEAVVTNKRGTTVCINELETIDQYTGLKDKNGKEIYVGDILRDYYGDFYTVSYSKGFYKATPQLLGDCKPLSDLCNCSFIMDNIYENKELLDAN